MKEREKVLQVTKEELGIDLESQASKLTQHLISEGKKEVNDVG